MMFVFEYNCENAKLWFMAVDKYCYWTHILFKNQDYIGFNVLYSGSLSIQV